MARQLFTCFHFSDSRFYAPDINKNSTYNQINWYSKPAAKLDDDFLFYITNCIDFFKRNNATEDFLNIRISAGINHFTTWTWKYDHRFYESNQLPSLMHEFSLYVQMLNVTC